MSTRLRIVNGALVLAVGGAVAAAVLVVGNPSGSARTGGRTTTVRTGTVTATVSTSGTVQSATQHSLSFQQSGTVTAIYVKVGQKVAAGAKLAAVDATSQQLAVDAAQASLQAAEDGLAAAEAGTPATGTSTGSQRTEAGATGGVAATTRPAGRTSAPAAGPTSARRSAPASSTAPVTSSPPVGSSPSPTPTPSPTPSTPTPTPTDSATGHVQTVALRVPAGPAATSATPSVNPQQVAQAQAQVYQAQSQLAQAQKALAETVLTAPVAGTVQEINGSVGGSSSTSGNGGSGSSGTGASAASGSSSSSGFIVLTDLDRLQVRGEVAEADIAKVRVGQPVTYTFSAVSGQTGPGGTAPVTGSVQAIDVTATVSSNVVEYGVTMAIDDPPAGLRLGQTATASIQTGSVDNALYVPTTAITTVGTRSTVTVKDTTGTHVVVVALGLAGDTDTQVTGGLTDGETVVLPTTTSTTGGTGNARFPGLGGGGLGIGR